MKNGNRKQHEIVDAARHLLGEDDAGQRALHPDEDQCRQRQRKPDRQPAEQRDQEPHQHQRARRRHRVRRQKIPRQIEPGNQGRGENSGDHVANGRAQKISSAKTVMNAAPAPIG